MNRSCRYGTSPLKFEICSGIAGPHGSRRSGVTLHVKRNFRLPDGIGYIFRQTIHYYCFNWKTRVCIFKLKKSNPRSRTQQ